MASESIFSWLQAETFSEMGSTIRRRSIRWLHKQNRKSAGYLAKWKVGDILLSGGDLYRNI